ncbi:hypothetical protein [Aquimarina sp. LLG6339-5]|uniref:hypothetical protein n=1 Tax=Aquimarina sp. LLG6339-5 TaxID=3160830 RepID=UPI003868E1DC
MQKTYLILFLILTFSCSQTDSQIAEFEKVMGDKQTKAINLLVSDFEKNLNKTYPDLSIEKGYEQYLNDLISDSTRDWEKFKFQSDKTNLEFHQSGLWDNIYSKDSQESLKINTTGKYIEALYSIKKPDPLIKIYREKRKAVGIMQNEILVNGIMDSDPDFNNYFHKRIVVLEFSF